MYSNKLVDCSDRGLFYVSWILIYRRTLSNCLYPLWRSCSGLLMGTVIIGISYFIQTMTVTKEVIFISIPVAIFIGAIMLSNNIRDLDNDKINGRKTIAILLGKEKAVQF